MLFSFIFLIQEDLTRWYYDKVSPELLTLTPPV